MLMDRVECLEDEMIASKYDVSNDFDKNTYSSKTTPIHQGKINFVPPVYMLMILVLGMWIRGRTSQSLIDLK